MRPADGSHPSPSDETDVVPAGDQRSEIRLFDVAAVFFFSLVTASVGIAIGHAIGGTDSYAERCGSLVGLWAGLVPGSVFVCRARGEGSFRTAVGLRLRLPHDLLGAAVGVICTYLLSFGYWVASHWIHGLESKAGKPAKDLTNNIRGPGFWLFAVLLVIGAPLVEEIFYRGLLFRSLKRYVSPTWAVLIGGFLFGAAHFNVITLVGLGAFGVVLCYLANRFGRLGPGIAAHAAFNLVAVIGLWASGGHG